LLALKSEYVVSVLTCVIVLMTFLTFMEAKE